MGPFLSSDRTRGEGVVTTRFLACCFKTGRLLFLQTIYVGDGLEGEKKIPLQRKRYKKLHVQIT